MNPRMRSTVAWSLLIAIGLPVWAADSRQKAEKLESGAAIGRTEEEPGDSMLKADDVIKVQVFQEDDINKQAENLTISKENAITLPLVGMVNLKDLTARQAQEKIRALYEKDFIVNPHVTVTIIKHADRSVNVIGAVNSPGRIPFPPDRMLTILDAITLAGGPNRLAKMKAVTLTRRNADGRPETTTHDVEAVFKKGGRDSVSLQKDDSIFVPEIIF
ncbi:MAG TPA: polysaccharide biosynthesis/export family protein [Opitutaceae bacterium]|nr:polysaccharide biosynthesis/export family protein [Opitutaceae bacterium]